MLRQLFSRKMELVVVKHFRLDSETMLKPGDPVPDSIRMFHKMSLYRRRLVGAKDDPWTLRQIPIVEPEPEVEGDEDSPDADGDE